MEEPRIVCMAHEELSATMTGLASDIRWLVVLCKWGLGLFLPIVGYAGVYLVKMDNRLVAIETLHAIQADNRAQRGR